MRREHNTPVDLIEPGKYLLMLVRQGNYYTSNDYGATFTERTDITTATKEFAAISKSGQYQAFCGGYGLGATKIYVSNNYGASFSPVGDSREWYGLGMSGDGKYMIGSGRNNGSIWISSDYGQTFTMKASLPTGYWRIPALSEDGKYMCVPLDYTNYAYVSSDYGATWTAKTVDTGARALTATMSANGQYMYVANLSNKIYKSSDYGVTWTKLTSLPGNSATVHCDASGQKIISGRWDGTSYYSNDYGVTWTAFTPSAIDGGFDISQDGTKIFMADYGGGIYSGNFGSNLTQIISTVRNYVSLVIN